MRIVYLVDENTWEASTDREKKQFEDVSLRGHNNDEWAETSSCLSNTILPFFRIKEPWCYWKAAMWASLVVQRLWIRLPMQGTQVRALVWEDPTCRGAAKPVRHNYWAWALEPASHNYWAHVPQLLKPACLEPMLRNKRSHCNEKPAHRNEE